ncbi:MAG: hypothetical protein ACRC1T_05605 [Clostridium chrysemydis]|uniref:hypothetical protein n=1 Tax=Clostridium chrysemydis TaxID=2665504 RepID=UPI003F3B8E43
MKIIGIDNLNRDTVSDILICENINKYYGEKLLKYLESECDKYSDCSYKLVEDGYNLYDATILY